MSLISLLRRSLSCTMIDTNSCLCSVSSSGLSRRISLNERMEDLEALTKYYVAFHANKLAVKMPKISAEFMGTLKKHHWKGNIRELKNIIERSLILCDGELLPEHLPFNFGSSSTEQQAVYDLAEIEKQHILKVLRMTGQNKTEAARLMCIGLTTLYRKLKDYGIEE